MGELTTVSRASSNFASLLTVIPMSIINQWKLKEGDKLEWEWQVLERGNGFNSQKGKKVK